MLWYRSFCTHLEICGRGCKPESLEQIGLTDMFCLTFTVLVKHKIWISISFTATLSSIYTFIDRECGFQFATVPTAPYCLPNNKARCWSPYVVLMLLLFYDVPQTAVSISWWLTEFKRYKNVEKSPLSLSNMVIFLI